MDLFQSFKNQKSEFLISPTNHPNIEYDWLYKKFKNKEIIFIGNIKIENENIIKYNNLNVAFCDFNKNLVTPILFHPLNLKKNEYYSIFNYLNELFNKKDENTKLNELIENLKENRNLIDPIIDYFYNKNIKRLNEANVSVEDAENLIKWIKEEDLNILKEYAQLKLLIKVIR